MRRLRRAKIVATLGPSSSDQATIARLFEAGADVFRINMSHTSHEAMRKLHAAIKAQAMQRGLMVYPMGGTIDGERGDHILLAPPFISSEAELGEIVARLADAVDAALA